MVKKWRVALVGAGYWAETVYLPQMARIRNAELTALCTRNPKRLQTLADTFGARERYTDYGEMLAECDFDILMNITPIGMHHEINMAALEAGRHVYSQKPFAPTVLQATEQIKAAERNGVKLSAAPIHRLRPSIRRARKMIADGVIGDVTFAKVSTAHGGPEYFQFRDNDPTWFFREGAGALQDMGVHALTVITSLMGPAKEMSCMAAVGEPQRTVRGGALDGMKIRADELPDNYIITLDFGGGRLGVADAGYIQKASRFSGFEIYGTAGTICIPHRLEEKISVYLDRPELGMRGWTDLMPQSPEDSEEFFQCMALADLIEAIEIDREAKLSPYHARHVIEMLERVPEALRVRRTITLDTKF